MATYKISYTLEKWYECAVEADSPEQAREKFWSGDYDDMTEKQTGSEIQDTIDIEEKANGNTR